MRFFKYLKDLFWTIICFLLVTLVINLILITSTNINKSLNDIIYMNLLIFSISLTFLIIGYIRWRNMYKDFINAIYNKKKIDGFIPKGEKLEQELIRKTVDLKNKEKLRETEQLKENLDELND